jgi:hypothetical protein
MRNPLNPEWILVGPTRPGGWDILTEHQSQATASTLTSLAQADARRASLDASSSDRASTAGLPDTEAQRVRREAMQRELVARWSGRSITATNAAPPADPRTARSTAPEDPRSMQPKHLLPSNDEANIPVAKPVRGQYWRSTSDLVAGAIRLSQYASLEDLEEHGVVHKDMGLSEQEFSTRVKAATRCSDLLGDAVVGYLLRLQMQAQARGYRFQAGATGVAPRSDYAPRYRPEGTIPESTQVPSRTTGVNPGSRYVINAAADLHLGHAGTGDRIRGPVRQSHRG